MKQLDFDRAFPQTPDCIHAAIELGFRKGQKKMKMQNKIIMFGSIAAALVIMFAAALATGGLNIAPQPDVLAQPEVTDIPKVQEEPMVWCTEKGTYYHSEEHCSGMKGAIYGTLSYALALDKHPCPVCVAVGEEGLLPTAAPVPEEYAPLDAKEENSEPMLTAVYTEYGKSQSYHRFKVCNGQEYRREITEKQAINEKLPACNSCYFGFVYYTDGGKYYHSDEHCMGMINAHMHNRDEAYTSGKLPCPTCLLVYCNEDGLYFHLLPDCMGMLFSDLHTLTDAYNMDNLRCPLCLSPSTVYATKTGKFFHTEEHCSGMVNASATTPEAEWQNGKAPCYVCITGDSTRTLAGNEIILSETEVQSEPSVSLPEHHELFVKAFGKSINDLLPGYSYSFESVQIGTSEDNYSRGWMVKRDTDPNEEAFPVVIEFEPGMGGYNGYLLVVNLSDNLKGEGGNNAHEFLKDAYLWKNNNRISLENLYNYAQLCINDETNNLKDKENLLSVSGVKVYFDANEEVYGYDVRYFYDETDPYILRTKIDEDGKRFYELLKNKSWIIG